jgi:WD40 repeat protein
MPTNPSPVSFDVTWGIAWPGPAFWSAATPPALGVLVLVVVWISRGRLNQTSRRVGFLAALSLVLCGVWLGVCPPPMLLVADRPAPPLPRPVAIHEPGPTPRRPPDRPPRLTGPFEPTRSVIFPTEVAAYPHLARVERVLNRLPFQSPLELCDIAWGEGGRTLVAADRSGANVWDTVTGGLRSRIVLDGENYNRAATNSDGARLVVIGKTARVLSLPLLETVQAIPKWSGSPDALALSSDGRRLALSWTSGSHGHLRVFNCDDASQCFHRQGPPMEALAWTPDSRYLAVGEGRGIVIFLSQTGDLVRPGIRLTPAEPIRSLAFSPQGDRLAVCTTESIGVYETYRRRKMWYHAPGTLDPQRPPYRFQRLCFNADGSELLVRRYQRHNRSWLQAYSIRTGEVVRERLVSPGHGDLMELSPDGGLLAYEDRNHSVSLCDAATFEPVVRGTSAWDGDTLSGDRNFPVGLRPSPDGTRLLTLCTRSLTLWDVTSGAELWSIGRPDWVRDACWDAAGTSIIVDRDGNADPTLKGAAVEVLDAEDGSVVREFLLDDPQGGPLLVLSDGRITACGNHHAYQLDADGNRLWKVPLCEGYAELSDIAMSPDESLIAVVHKLSGGDIMPHSGFSQGSVFLLDGATGERRQELLSPTTPERVAFSPDGRRVLASTNNHPRRMGQHHLADGRVATLNENGTVFVLRGPG